MGGCQRFSSGCRPNSGLPRRRIILKGQNCRDTDPSRDKITFSAPSHRPMALCALSPTLELVPARHRECYSSMWTNRSDPVLGQLLNGPGDVIAESFIDTMLKARRVPRDLSCTKGELAVSLAFLRRQALTEEIIPSAATNVGSLMLVLLECQVLTSTRPA
ncbi:hypothetical protein EDB80DRAFT_772266 [Ilyonectria destructans]|nr:hypothetical protein EDB80DRAFT_772266 [Ilyonectria destructans]